MVDYTKIVLILMVIVLMVFIMFIREANQNEFETWCQRKCPLCGSPPEGVYDPNIGAIVKRNISIETINISI